jgi:hypothetical protein
MNAFTADAGRSSVLGGAWPTFGFGVAVPFESFGASSILECFDGSGVPFREKASSDQAELKLRGVDEAAFGTGKRLGRVVGEDNTDAVWREGSRWLGTPGLVELSTNGGGPRGLRQGVDAFPTASPSEPALRILVNGGEGVFNDEAE